MATENQIEANRMNAQHCTGPKTEEGKARASQNALKTGLYSQKEVIATESREDYESLAADYHNHYSPANPHERSLVDALVRYEWLSRRYMAADTALWNLSLDGGKTEPGRAFMYHAENLSRAGRYFNTARKGFSATLKELKALQAERKSEETAEPSATAERQPMQNQPVTGKLVSFRQPAETPGADPEPSTKLALESEEIPPLAA